MRTPVAAAGGAAGTGDFRGRRRSWRARLRVLVASALGTLLLRALGATWRVRRVNGECLDEPLRRGERLVVVFWHGELLPIAWVHRRDGVVPLVSTHADGEIITRILHRLGYRTVRGSTSRGGARALLDMASLLEGGTSVAVTPDGPRGPQHVFAPGALAVAWRSGARVLGIGVTADRAWRLRSWDRHLIPKPFARVTLRYSMPEAVRADSLRATEAEADRFRALLQSLRMPNA